MLCFGYLGLTWYSLGGYFTNPPPFNPLPDLFPHIRTQDTYGLEYDLDLFNIVAVDDFNMGAMENKSLNIFNSR